MHEGFAELPMYVAPARVQQASERWLNLIAERLGWQRQVWEGTSLADLWLSPRLLLAQTCGYPLVTQLRGQVHVVGKPVYRLPHGQGGEHCSLLVGRGSDTRRWLHEFFDSHGLVNSRESNSGMNLLRHSLMPWQRDGRFFDSVSITGGHRDSLLALREHKGDLAAIDSVTWDYLLRDISAEVAGLRIVSRSVSSPCLPYVTALPDQADAIRQAMNDVLLQVPELADELAIEAVEPATQDDYEVLLAYERQARDAEFDLYQETARGPLAAPV